MIVVRNVRKRFGPVAALDGVALEIRRGERVAIVGTNGSGKTTLLRALVGLIRFEGTIEIDGIDVAGDPERALALVSYSPQIAPVLDVPVAEFLRVHCALRGTERRRIEERAARLGLDLSPIRRTRFRDLSGGMKQKLLAALTLASDAPVVACDEPTANLDTAARIAFFEQIAERSKDAVLVLCSHRVDEVRHLVDRVVELRDGRVFRDAPLAELLGVLRTVRVEVVTRADASKPFAELLARRTFERVGSRRWSGRVTLDEKVRLMAELLRAYEREILDLEVCDEGEVASLEESPPTPSKAPPTRRVA